MFVIEPADESRSQDGLLDAEGYRAPDRRVRSWPTTTCSRNQCGHRNTPGRTSLVVRRAPLASLREDPTTVTFFLDAGEAYDELSVEYDEVPAGTGVLVEAGAQRRPAPSPRRTSSTPGAIPRATSSSTT